MEFSELRISLKNCGLEVDQDIENACNSVASCDSLGSSLEERTISRVQLLEVLQLLTTVTIEKNE